MRSRTVFAVLALLVSPPVAATDGDAPSALGAEVDGRVHPVPRITAAIEIDGMLDEPVWSTALELPLGYETSPGDNIDAPVPTSCRLAYDDRAFYVGCKASDPEPHKIRARYHDRDGAFSDDFIGVVLDTFNDERRAYEFFVNPLGVQMDLIYDDVNGNEDSSWDAIWVSAGRVTDSGYEVEMQIPFSSLRFQRGAAAQTWGLDMLRVWPREHRYRIGLNKLPRDVSCYLCVASKIEGFDGAEPGRNLEINPTFTAGRTERIDPDAPGAGLTFDETDYDPGLDVRWGFTPSLTLNATLNPDFSQVEADAARLDVNEPFALFFPEKRPFFLEGGELFDSPISAVYTRNIADPAWGAKITGKEGANALGVFVAQDEETTLILPGAQRSRLARLRDQENTAAVVRYRRDVGESSAIGAIVTARDGQGYDNAVYGVDAMFRPTQKDTIRAQFLGSSTEYSDEIAADFNQPVGRFDDTAYTVRYGHGERNWSVSASRSEFGEDFRADLGFVTRVGYDVTIAGGQYRWYGDEENWYSRITVGGDWDETNESDGTLIERETEAFAWAQGPRQSFMFVGGGFRDRGFNGVELDERFVNTDFEINLTKDLFLDVEHSWSDRFDFGFAPEPGVARQGDEFRRYLALRMNAGQHLNLRLSYSYRELDLPDGSLVAYDAASGTSTFGRGTVFEADVTEMRLVYQFGLRAFLRLLAQYEQVTFDRNPGVGAPPEDSEELFGQLLFSYKLNPRTAFFVGLTEDRETNLDPTDPRALTAAGRTVFAKIGYAWVP